MKTFFLTQRFGLWGWLPVNDIIFFVCQTSSWMTIKREGAILLTVICSKRLDYLQVFIPHVVEISFVCKVICVKKYLWSPLPWSLTWDQMGVRRFFSFLNRVQIQRRSMEFYFGRGPRIEGSHLIRSIWDTNLRYVGDHRVLWESKWERDAEVMSFKTHTRTHSQTHIRFYV